MQPKYKDWLENLMIKEWVQGEGELKFIDRIFSQLPALAVPLSDLEVIKALIMFDRLGPGKSRALFKLQMGFKNTRHINPYTNSLLILSMVFGFVPLCMPLFMPTLVIFPWNFIGFFIINGIAAGVCCIYLLRLILRVKWQDRVFILKYPLEFFVGLPNTFIVPAIVPNLAKIGFLNPGGSGNNSDWLFVGISGFICILIWIVLPYLTIAFSELVNKTRAES